MVMTVIANDGSVVCDERWVGVKGGDGVSGWLMMVVLRGEWR